MAHTATLIGPRIETDPWYTSSPYEPVEAPITRLSDIDLLDGALYAQGDPHAVWKLMREKAPIFWHERGSDGTDGEGFWAVTRYAAIREVHRNVGVFSNRKGFFLDLPAEQLPHGLGDMDAPEHRVHRAVVTRFLAPRAMRRWEGQISEMVTRLIDDVIERGSCDFAEEALKLPMLATSALIGVSPSETRELKQMLDCAVSNEQNALEAYNRCVLEFFGRCIEERRTRCHGDSIIGVVAGAEIDGRPITLEEGASLLHQLFTAGVDSTGITAAIMLLSLFHHPEQLAMWIADPSLTESAVEELLRWTALVHANKRWVLEDTELEGQRLRRGDFVATWHPSASRDERAFRDPYKLDLKRTSANPIPTFGGGAHHCIGAYFARLELRVLFREALARMKALEQTGPAVRVDRYFTLMVAPVRSLPVAFTPADRLIPAA